MNPAEQTPIIATSICLTQDCSLRCSYCFAGKKYKAAMSPELAKRCIEWLLSRSVSGETKEVKIDFWGGEPLLRWGLIQELVEYGNRQAQSVGKRIGWNMTTNAVHLTEPILEGLDRLNIGYMVSVDGLPDAQNTQRKLANGEGSYDLVAANIARARQHKPHLKGRMTVVAERAHLYDQDIRHLFDGLGLERVLSSPDYSGDWTSESMDAYRAAINRLATWYMAQMRKGRPIWFKWLDDAWKNLLAGRYLSNGESYICGAGRTFVGIGVDGAIYPCHRYDDFDDRRPWQEKEYCLGHIDHGITRPELRAEKFMKRVRTNCPGCIHTNEQCTGDPFTTPELAKLEQLAWREEAVRVYNELMEERCNPFVAHLRKHALNKRVWRRFPKGLPRRFDIDGTPNWAAGVVQIPSRQRLQKRIVEHAKAILLNPGASAEDIRLVAEAMLSLAR